MRHSDILTKDRTAIVLIDYQEKLLAAMHNTEEIIKLVLPFANFISNLKIPVIITEQNPEGIGSTVPEVREGLPGAKVIKKLSFSCFSCLDFVQALEIHSPRNLVIGGIETHVCIEQTALDAIERGFCVHVVADICSSRRQVHHEIGVSKMRDAGAIVTSTESVIFEILERAGTPIFKETLRLIK